MLSVARGKLLLTAAEGYLVAGQPRSVAQVALALARGSGCEPTIDLDVLTALLMCSTGGCLSSQCKSKAERMYRLRLLMLNFFMHQSGIDFKCPYSNRPSKPLTPSIGLTQSLFRGT
jgi:hypothetical protein